MSAAEAGDRTHAPLSLRSSSTPLDRSSSLCAHAQLHEPLPKGAEWRGADRGRAILFKKALEYDGVVRPPLCGRSSSRGSPRATRPASTPPGVEPNLADYEDRCERRLPLHTHPTHTQDAVCFCAGALRVVSQQPDQGFSQVLDLGKFDEESMKDWEAVIFGCIANRDLPLTSEFRRSSPQSRLRARTRTRRW